MAFRLALLLLIVFCLNAVAELPSGNCPQYLGNGNILLTQEDSGLTLGARRYDLIKSTMFDEAFVHGLKEAELRIKTLAESQEVPNFENTILAFEQILEPLDLAESLLEHLVMVHANAHINAVAEKYSPAVERLAISVFHNDAIFKRVKSVYDRRQALSLPPTEATLVENIYRTFIKNGALLTSQQKNRLSQIVERLEKLRGEFSSHALNSVQAFELLIKDKEELRGLPDSYIRVAEKAAKKSGKDGWLLTLDDDPYFQAMNYLDNRSLREQLWKAMNTCATCAPFDNRPLVLEIAKLRQEQARLLGNYRSYADFQLEDRMIGSLERLDHLLDQLAKKYKAQATLELGELREIAGHDLEPWDIRYYSEKLKQMKFGFNEEDLRPYFEFEQVLQGAFQVAKKLFGVSFISRPDLPKWHPSVRVYEVRDRHGKELGLYYLDPFSRQNKYPGAWSYSARRPGMFGNDSMRRPHIVNILNFSQSSGDQPQLLNLTEVTMTFHELGHALHAILTQVPYPSISGTKVALDFVEVPSLLNERWAFEADVLKTYARHYKTGEAISSDWVEKIKQVQSFQAGYLGLRQILFAKLDLAWHARDDLDSVVHPSQVFAYETEMTKAYQVLNHYESLLSVTFHHIFSASYASGYYTYKLDELLADDAFSEFQRNGLFDQDTADRWKTEVLERGGSENAATLYRRFRKGKLFKEPES